MVDKEKYYNRTELISSPMGHNVRITNIGKIDQALTINPDELDAFVATTGIELGSDPINLVFDHRSYISKLRNVFTGSDPELRFEDAFESFFLMTARASSAQNQLKFNTWMVDLEQIILNTKLSTVFKHELQHLDQKENIFPIISKMALLGCLLYETTLIILPVINKHVDNIHFFGLAMGITALATYFLDPNEIQARKSQKTLPEIEIVHQKK